MYVGNELIFKIHNFLGHIGSINTHHFKVTSHDSWHYNSNCFIIYTISGVNNETSSCGMHKYRYSPFTCSSSGIRGWIAQGGNSRPWTCFRPYSKQGVFRLSSCSLCFWRHKTSTLDLMLITISPDLDTARWSFRPYALIIMRCAFIDSTGHELLEPNNFSSQVHFFSFSVKNLCAGLMYILW